MEIVAFGVQKLQSKGGKIGLRLLLRSLSIGAKINDLR